LVSFAGVPHMMIVDARREDWMKAVDGFLQPLH